MKFTTVQTAGSAALLLAVQPAIASSHHRHQHLGKRHSHGHNNTEAAYDRMKDRSLGTCSFPDGEGLVAITPGKDNAGWALSPDQFCTCGSYCPYACPPGKVMAQWKDGSTYATVDRMAGGLFCGLDGKATKPFGHKEYCVDGAGTVDVVNKAGDVVSFCQTVLPGNEDILIPNDIHGTSAIAVPDTSYWQATAAHYYINAPGVNSATGCHWGDESKPIGNWAPYVAGANMDASGLTYVKLGTNPIWQSSALYSTKPSFGMKIECPSGKCVGLPCAIDGNGVTSDLKATGAGGSDFCVVTVPKGGKANIVVYNLDGSTGSSGSSSGSSQSTAAAATPSSEPAPTTKSATPTSTSTSTTSTKSASTTSSTPTTTSTTHSSSSSPVQSTSSSASVSPSSTSSSFSSSSSASPSGYSLGGIFQENGTNPTGYSRVSPTTTAAAVINAASGAAAAPSESSKNESAGSQSNGAIAGLVIAFIAAACIL